MGQMFTAFSGADGQPSEAEKLFLKLAAESEPVDLTELPDDPEARRISPALVRAAVTGAFRHADCQSDGFSRYQRSMSRTISA